jgi:hypothetical protein
LPLQCDLVIVVSHFPHIGYFGVICLAEQAGEAHGVEQRVFTTMHRNHAEPECLLAHW